ncbi:hypothetical protein TrispH2_006166 [Trichoplax sp. H2]|nr:hypothetical protein TrispH2_006166 [Trichoplax sp. H2]|eukprot:RDD41232.1 hypothetical protein TrispH2_006166 [Trichoplax sp. H2]
MAKFSFFIWLIALLLISVSYDVSASVVPDDRYEEFVFPDRESDDRYDEEDEEIDEIIDAKRVNQRLEPIAPEKVDYNLFDEKAADILIGEAEKASTKIDIILTNEKNHGSNGGNNGGSNGGRFQCPSFSQIRQGYLRVKQNFTAIQKAIAAVKKAKGESFIRYKVYHNLAARFCANSNTTMCSYVKTSQNAENTKYTNATAGILAQKKRLFQYAMKIMAIARRFARCFRRQ